MRNHALYLKDILAAINAIEGFVVGMSEANFQNDDKTVSAVIRKLEIIGEAVKGVPDDVKLNHPHIPWKEMAGMRDKLIHFYFGVDYPLVWETVKKRLPLLKPEIEQITTE